MNLEKYSDNQIIKIVNDKLKTGEWNCDKFREFAEYFNTYKTCRDYIQAQLQNINDRKDL